MWHWSLTIRCWFMRHSNHAFLISCLLSDMLSCHFMLGCHFMLVSLFNSRHAWMGTWMINRHSTLYFCGLNPIWRGGVSRKLQTPKTQTSDPKTSGPPIFFKDLNSSIFLLPYALWPRNVHRQQPDRQHRVPIILYPSDVTALDRRR